MVTSQHESSVSRAPDRELRDRSKAMVTGSEKSFSTAARCFLCDKPQSKMMIFVPHIPTLIAAGAVLSQNAEFICRICRNCIAPDTPQRIENKIIALTRKPASN